MKNNIILTCILFFSFIASSFGEPYRFETAEIEIVDSGNFVYAKNGKAFSEDGSLEIEAKDFEYSKASKTLKAFNGNALIKSENIKIDFKELILDDQNSIITARDSIKIFDFEKKLTITTDLIIYDQKLNLIKSSTKSIMKDKIDNVLDAQAFEYDIKKNILKVKNANLKDFKNNNFNIDLAYINTVTNKIFGKDISVDLINESFGKDNEPRLKGNSVISDNEITEITKGVFTTCKKRDKCPPWQLSAEKISHNKKKQIINYKNAWLKVYDVPVMYFPKFFHPDPTVKRRSGFLAPSFKSSNSYSYLSIPYFKVLGNNKDMTITPRIYGNDKIMLQSEYRQENFNSSHISDVSFLNDNKDNSKSHFFYKFNKGMDFMNFDDTQLSVKIEQTSNDTYLKKNKIVSPLILGTDILENSISFDMSNSDLSIDSEIKIYEDLNNKDDSDRYEFILPKVDLVKKIDNKTNLNGNFFFKSNNSIKNYATNIFEKININNLIFNSNPNITSSGFYNSYDFIVKNVNSDSQNSNNFKEDGNTYVSGLFQFNSSLPMKKEGENYQNILKPKLSLKMSPNYTKDISDKENRIDVNNLFNLERISSQDTIEGGLSLAYGSDYTVFNKSSSREIFSLKLGNNLRYKDNDDLPSDNQIHTTTSNFLGEISYTPNDFLTTKYNISTKNNLSDATYEDLTAEISLNNFVTTFDYINENFEKNNNSYLTNTTKYSFNNSNSVSFSTRENKTSDLTEYYNFMYQYKNDCLAASIEYNKDYYDDRDIKPEENVFLKLTIIPFGETSSPNIKN